MVSEQLSMNNTGTGTRSNRWARVREECIGKDKILVNDINEDGNSDVKVIKTETVKPTNKVSFFNVVKEASAVEKIKKERPSLLKFLSKFDSVDAPESVTPNPSHCFSHFQPEDQEDTDSILLKQSIQRVSGTVRELATPTFTVTINVILRYF